MPSIFRAATAICVEFGSLFEIEDFPAYFSRTFISTQFELIKKHAVSGVCSAFRKDERKVQTDFFCRST